MKKFNITFLFLFSGLILFGQTEVPKYVLLEHFTNSVCGICASRNPAFYNTIANYPGQVHHISYHPPAPYSSCLLYQHNTVQNSERTAFYNVFGTPSIVMEGEKVSGGSQLLPASKLEEKLGQTSPVEVIVTETTGNDRMVDIKIKTWGTAPTGNLKLYAAIVEKNLYYSSPNGETVHHDVFRRMLTDINGDDITLTSGGELDMTFTYSIHNQWEADEIYVVAFVQDADTKAIINSGTRFDERSTAVKSPILKDQLRLFPNPTSGNIQLDLGKFQHQEAQVRIYDTAGREVFAIEGNERSIDVNALPKGLYVLKVNVEEGVLVERFIKE